MSFVKNKFNPKKIFLLYLFGGVSNTILSIALYNLLIFFFKISIAYSIAWICGLIFSYYFNKKIVFKKISSPVYIMVYFIVYIFLCILSFEIFNLLIFSYKFNESFALLITIFLFIPINYYVNKIFFYFTKMK